MRKQFQYGKYLYEYSIKFEDRKTLSLTVTPRLEIVVKAPKDTGIEKIERFLKKKWIWLERQMRYFAKFKKSCCRKEYVSGESYYYLGRQYRLIVEQGNNSGVLLKRGKLILTTNQGVENSKVNRKILKKWFLQRAKVIFQERLEEVFPNFNYSCSIPSLQIKQMSKRWGSYLGKERIHIHSGLIHAPKDCIDYVISHELCHFKYKNHTAAFKRLLNDKCPSWERTKDKLETKYL
jgi:predicted metal-dependent hydrolase